MRNSDSQSDYPKARSPDCTEDGGLDNRGSATLWSSFANVALGVFLIHPLAFVFAWLKGFFLGAGGGPAPMAPTPVFRPVRYGFEGGVEGVGELFIVYLFTLGLFPLFISMVGGVLGYTIGGRLTKRFPHSEPRAKSEVSPKSLLNCIALWASSLTIVGACLTSLLMKLSLPDDLVTFRKFTIGMHLFIWAIGIVVAFIKESDRRVALWLIVVAFCLPLISPWMPRFSILAVSIGVWVYFLIKQRFVR